MKIFSVNDGAPLRPGEDWVVRGEGLNGADGKSISPISWSCNLEVSDPVTPEGHGGHCHQSCLHFALIRLSKSLSPLMFV